MLLIQLKEVLEVFFGFQYDNSLFCHVITGRIISENMSKDDTIFIE